VRQRFASEPWWGYPAVIFGADADGQMLVRALQREPELGLKPIAIIDDDPDKMGYLEGIPVLRGSHIESHAILSSSHVYAVVSMSTSLQPSLVSLVERYGPRFSHVLVVPKLASLSALWVSPKRVGGLIGLEVRQQVLAYRKFVAKRVLDVCLTLIVGIFALPLVLLLALLVCIESRGSAFYGHSRIGRGNRSFRAWKLRSMVQNSDQVLSQCLENNPAMREEWLQTQKLKADPRITRIGSFLRRTSLDELPQLWNVVKGEMSLVGPRPIVPAEVARYGEHFELYTRVLGGVTGLWQVSGRNNTTYEERVSLDVFYARNWSVWLDLCILFRTIGTVLFRKGAY
jgi:Undecaprenyl-phosphate galactose phosphotransferase WbaP